MKIGPSCFSLCNAECKHGIEVYVCQGERGTRAVPLVPIAKGKVVLCNGKGIFCV